MDKTKLEFLISQGESYNVEFRQSNSDPVAKDICAFVNCNGGYIFIGVDDFGKRMPININNRLKSQIHDRVRNFDPKLEIQLEEVDGVLVVTVPEGTNKPYSTGGKFYMRYGTNSQQLTRDEIRDFFYSEGMILFDEERNPQFDLEKDFSSTAYNEFIVRAGISQFLEKQVLLDNLGLSDHGKIRNAGVLLFCNTITKFFPSATITCITFQGDERLKILDRKEFDAGLLSNFQNSMNYLKEKLNTEYIIRGSGARDEKLELPQEALREALLNAIAHRDYLATTSIFVEIYSSRVEIVNSGGLVKGLQLKELGETSRPRNPLLFGLMQRMNLVEKAGTGIKRMISAMEEYHLRPMKIDADETKFKVIFERPKTSYEGRIFGKSADTSQITPPVTPPVTPLIHLTELEFRVLEEITKDNRISASQLAKKLGISRDTVKEYLQKLRGKGVIERIGITSGGHWLVKDTQISKPK